MVALSELKSMVKTLGRTAKVKPLATDSCMSLGLMVENNAKKTPNAIMVIFEEQSISWGEFNALANRLAHALEKNGIQRGDTVSILMENRIENLAAITAICKLGAIAGMINTNLIEQPLLHCIESVNASAVIFGGELCESLNTIRSQLKITAKERLVFISDTPNSASHALSCPKWASQFDVNDNSLSEKNLPQTHKIQLKELAYYIFTSGTTGLPKASLITHDRHHRMSVSFSRVALDMQASDRIYICLPLYHSSAMFIGFGTICDSGASMFLRRKFSASSFVAEARQYNTTIFAYIGELCRYLLHQPQKPDDGNNPVVKCVGNGLRPDIWMEFKNRFQIDHVGEFYGASEGNAGCLNAFNKDLTVGLCSAKHSVIKYNVVDDEIVRDAKGLCKKAAKGEPGLFAIEISDKAKFDGYADKKASDKKIIRNVRKKGDMYFNTGDLLKQIDVGFAFGLPHYQFIDRVGDTYRWKGENVSTNEVGELLNACDEIQYCNIYGVQVPATDGRAGMAAIMPSNKELNLKRFSEHVIEKVPAYARPLFIRCLSEMDTTGTFKMKKGELREEAFHPEKHSDRILVLKPNSKIYEELDSDFYKRIMDGLAGF